MSLKWRKNQQVSSGRPLLSRTRLLADINHLCKSRFKKNGRISEKLFFHFVLGTDSLWEKFGRTMVFLNKKRNRFMKRNVVIVSQQSSSMRTIKKIRPGGVFQQQHLFLSNYVGRKKRCSSLYQMGLHLVVCGRSQLLLFLREIVLLCQFKIMSYTFDFLPPGFNCSSIFFQSYLPSSKYLMECLIWKPLLSDNWWWCGHFCGPDDTR